MLFNNVDLKEKLRKHMAEKLEKEGRSHELFWIEKGVLSVEDYGSEVVLTVPDRIFLEFLEKQFLSDFNSFFQKKVVLMMDKEMNREN